MNIKCVECSLDKEQHDGWKLYHEFKATQSHTPTPWTFEESEDGLGFNIYGRFVGDVEPQIVEGVSLSNAAFIVRAVNAHGELVEAVKDYIGDLTTAKGQWTIERLKRLLAKAEGK